MKSKTVCALITCFFVTVFGRPDSSKIQSLNEDLGVISPAPGNCWDGFICSDGSYKLHNPTMPIGHDCGFYNTNNVQTKHVIHYDYSQGLLVEVYRNDVVGLFYAGTQYNISKTFGIPTSFRFSYGKFRVGLYDYLDGYLFVSRCFDARISK